MEGGVAQSPVNKVAGVPAGDKTRVCKGLSLSRAPENKRAFFLKEAILNYIILQEK